MPAVTDRTFRLTGLGETREVVAARILERFDQPTTAELLVRVLADAEPIDAESGVFAPVVLEMLENDEVVRAWHLVVRALEDHDEGPDGVSVRVELTDRFGVLAFRRDLRIFQEKTTVDIVKAVLEGAGIDLGTCDFRVARALSPRVYCVQHRETDLDFVQRLLAFEGIFTFPADDAEGAKLVLADSSDAFEAIDGEASLALVEGGFGTGVRDFDVDWSMTTEEVVLRDYNEETPGIDLTCSATSGGRAQRYEFPGGHRNKSDGDALAKIRLEEHQSGICIGRGVALVPSMRVGRFFTLASASREDLNVDWLLRTVEHRFEKTGGAELAVYENRFEASPRAQPYRPRRRPRVVVPGSHPIKVTGPSGSEIHTEALGRMKGKFYWDRVGNEDDKATCWMRVLQLPIGASQALARVGWEMIVRHQYGDPDRPVAICRTDNGAHTAPYAYPKAASAMSFKTLSSPGGAKFNEISMEDGGGGMKLAVTASKDWDEQVNNDKTEKIGVDEKLEVGTDMGMTVGANQTVKIGASRTCTVGGDAGVAVAGNRTKTVGASETITISGNLTEKINGSDTESVGASHITVAALGINRTSQGSHTLTVGGAMLSVAGMGCAVAVGGAKSESIGGAKLVLAGGAVAETVVGAAAVAVGGAMVHAAGGNRMGSAKGSSRLVVGGAAIVNAAGKISMKAPTIRMTVAGTANFLGGGGILNLTPASATATGLVTVKASGAVKVTGGPNLMT